MSTNLACFLFGIPVTVLWAFGIKKGIMYGARNRWIRRNNEPFLFWFMTAFSGSVALGLLVAPILSWTGLRE
ncbi:hypothetical protein [Rariglobus hedericola]|uniref:Uncharacterized protein n=1 Tax=Rariglobus hedericola TaxID=2597822 RepID=A0A556QCX6_9BACT|nr:hypothetical protein [Rariglobus hedericola]TSJ74491.1 hypothetical protein FPL22_17550 [Rariglobus hedericola]